ncbi:Zinc finger protein 62 [Folsomia candida]|uniref:Zinc finger protein 62 n=1 Tax=Folsomia candida TaxID=158441 RepID=A0A226EAK0_FOLCA|nr:Zinc finger protein 62 [Folsomia candida]
MPENFPESPPATTSRDRTCSPSLVLLLQKKFPNNTSLRDHMTIHTGEVAYFCNVEKCGFSTSTHCGLVSHVKNMHTVGRTRKSWPCYFCSVTATRMCKLAQHLNTHTQEKPWRCTLCKKTYRSSEGLKYHYTSHTQEKPYKCPTCEKSYASSSVLQNHKPRRVYLSEHIKRKHSNVPKPHHCKHCESKFWKKIELRHHTDRVHVNPKEKKCGIFGSCNTRKRAKICFEEWCEESNPASPVSRTDTFTTRLTALLHIYHSLLQLPNSTYSLLQKPRPSYQCQCFVLT